jgi:hypothetical protein
MLNELDGRRFAAACSRSIVSSSSRTRFLRSQSNIAARCARPPCRRNEMLLKRAPASPCYRLSPSIEIVLPRLGHHESVGSRLTAVCHRRRCRSAVRLGVRRTIPALMPARILREAVCAFHGLAPLCCARLLALRRCGGLADLRTVLRKARRRFAARRFSRLQRFLEKRLKARCSRHAERADPRVHQHLRLHQPEQ